MDRYRRLLVDVSAASGHADGGDRNPFVSGGGAYAASRPGYPPALGRALAVRCPRRQHALDVGCGSGQLSLRLTEWFERVTATDASDDQFAGATAHPAVTYRRQPAERFELAAASVDLVAAAQAAHWFDLDAFYREVRRVGRGDAVLALLCYGVPVMHGAVGERLAHFYWQEIHRYWPAPRRHVENGYRTLAFPFEETPLPDLTMDCRWSRAQLVAYIRTWSAVRRAHAAGAGRIVAAFARDLSALWPDADRTRTVTWPLAGRFGRVHA